MKFKLNMSAFRPKKIILFIPILLKTAYLFICFFLMIFFIIIGRFYRLFEKIPLVGKLFVVAKSLLWKKKIQFVYNTFFTFLEASRYSEVKRSYLIKLALKNLMAKKTRTFITILGMSFGVGIIILLLSLGYGVEKLVIGKVASLDELKIIDVSMGENTALHLNQNFIKQIEAIPHVQSVIPLISMVGKITYNKANTDSIVYATTLDFLNYSKLKLIQGKLFSMVPGGASNVGQVAGASTVRKAGIYAQSITGLPIDFTINPESPATVWEECSLDSPLLGYLPRKDGVYQGMEYWGDIYAPFSPYGRVGYDTKANKYLGKWIRARVPLFNKQMDGTVKPMVDNIGQQIYRDACLPETNLQITHIYEYGQVLGEATESASLLNDQTASYSASLDRSVNNTLFESVSASSSSELEIVSLVATASATKGPEVLNFSSEPSKIAVVSSGMLNLLNISLSKAVGTKFNVSFIITKNLKPELEGRGITKEVEYQIGGVIDDARSTYFFIPLADMDKLGVTQFSQTKVVLTNKDYLPQVRKTIENYGFRTTSTVDTVQQIESLFANLRIILGLMGMVALAVASLGMFNTLTVSLLERTREIGGMKTMGVISNEIQDLFLAEAMILGLAGGVGGLIIGYIIGNLISMLVSVVAVANGQGYLNLTYIPFFLSSFIIMASFFVGLLTGLYPAQRAKHISALNALRYE